MATVGLSEAAESLRDYFGERVDADLGKGPDVMADALVERWHISKDEARKLVDDLIKAGSVRFMSGGPRPGADEAAPVAGGQIATSGMPTAAAGLLPGQSGYWQFK